MKIIILDDIDEPLKIELKKAIERMANPAETIPAPTPVFNPNPAPEDTKLVKKLQDAMENTTYKPSPEIGKNAFAIQPGTFEWALIQMKVGKDVRRPEWISGECLEKRNTFIIYCEPKCHRSSHWYPKCHDLTATDWMIVT